MVRQVDEDTRGLVAPAAGLRRFSLTRHEPSEQVARFVDRYWVVEWDLAEPYTQQVLAHPVVNVTTDGEESIVTGVQTRTGSRTLSGSGRVLGVMFRPGGFRPLLHGPLATITDRALPALDVLGPEVTRGLERAAAAADSAAIALAADAVLAGVLPEAAHPCEEATGVAERIAADRSLTSVELVAAATDIGVRRLQRMFAEHVGLSPKRVIRRYRLYDAAERVARGDDVSWAQVAAELGYSDQAHLTRDFSAAFGTSPSRYAELNRAALTADRAR